VDQYNVTVIEADAGMDLNPLVPSPDPQNGVIRLTNHVYSLSGTLAKVFGLGDQQDSALRNAMFQLYESHGMSRNEPIQDDGSITWPSFMELHEHVIAEGNQLMLNRVSPLFELQLFQGTGGTLDDLLRRTTVLRLSRLPNERIQNAVADMFLRGVYQTLLGRGPLDNDGMRIAILIDEAHKVAELGATKTLLKEARKYGACIWLSSQEPSDFSDSVFANCGTLIAMRLELDAHAKKIALQLTERELSEQVRSLGVGEAFMRNMQYEPYIKLRIEEP